MNRAFYASQYAPNPPNAAHVRKTTILLEVLRALPYVYTISNMVSRDAYRIMSDDVDPTFDTPRSHANGESPYDDHTPDKAFIYLNPKYLYQQLGGIQITMRRANVVFTSPVGCLVCNDPITRGRATMQLLHLYNRANEQPIESILSALCDACAHRRLSPNEIEMPPAVELFHPFASAVFNRFIDREVLPHQDTPIAVVEAAEDRVMTCICCHTPIDIHCPTTFCVQSGMRKPHPGCRDMMFLLPYHTRDECAAAFNLRVRIWEENTRIIQSVKAPKRAGERGFDRCANRSGAMRSENDRGRVSNKFVDYYHVTQWVICSEQHTLDRLMLVQCDSPLVFHKCLIPTCGCNMFTEQLSVLPPAPAISFIQTHKRPTPHAKPESAAFAVTPTIVPALVPPVAPTPGVSPRTWYKTEKEVIASTPSPRPAIDPRSLFHEVDAQANDAMSGVCAHTPINNAIFDTSTVSTQSTVSTTSTTSTSRSQTHPDTPSFAPSPYSITSVQHRTALQTVEHVRNEINALRRIRATVDTDTSEYSALTSTHDAGAFVPIEQICADLRRMQREYHIPQPCFLLTYIVFRMVVRNPYDDLFLTPDFYRCANPACRKISTQITHPIECHKCGIFRACSTKCEAIAFKEHLKWCHNVRDHTQIYSLFYFC